MEDHQKKGVAKWVQGKWLRKVDARWGMSSKMGIVRVQPAIFARVTSKGLRGYPTWKSTGGEVGQSVGTNWAAGRIIWQG
jgi:hypothetical protein